MKIEKIVFPTNSNYRYYNVHYKYVKDSILAAGISLELSDKMKQVGGAAFEIQIDDQIVLVDFFNHTPIVSKNEDYEYYFKFQYSEGIHEDIPNIYPMGTISFYDWLEYSLLKNDITYKATGKVLNNQRGYGKAVERRRDVQHMLKQKFNSNVDVALTPQDSFWRKINDCLVSVCVPGARNDILDRGQLQYFAFGCCTISPKILTILPFQKKLVPDKHYIICKDDYSDLISKIEWCQKNREECIEIGKNAQELYEATSTPQQLWKYVDQVIYKD